MSSPKQMPLDSLMAPNDAEREAQLWQSLRAADGSSHAARHALIAQHTPYARAIAAKLYAGRFRDDVPFEDYFQFACIGLIESIDRYDPASMAQFRTFANLRIRGAVLDGLECMTEQRQQYPLIKRLKSERIQSLTEQHESKPLHQLNQDALLAQLAEIGIGAALSYMIDHSGMLARESEQTQETPYASDQLKQLTKSIADLVDQLSSQEKKVITMHYYNETPFETIATLMGLTKGRISQIHKQALLRLHTLAKARPPSHRAW
jgi:RNA polymerase sigma factor FliA